MAIAAQETLLRAQESLVTAMMEPAFYPKAPETVTHKETHISHLFFAGELVYKIKKPVNFSFLDFTSVGRRRYFLNEELRLNRRLAPSVYLGVLPICLDESSGWRLVGWGEPMDYTLVMRRLPDRRMLPFLLETHQVTADMMKELAHALASFHERADRYRPADPTEYMDRVVGHWDENFSDLRPFVGVLVDADELKLLREFGKRFFDRHRGTLMRRAEENWVREVHGDLHCEHICFGHEGVQIFDCIEFSADLRRCDLASEISFLMMDLEFRGAKSMADAFLENYLTRLEDPELPQLLPFFACYRALVRCKVNALRGRNEETARYCRFAQRYIWSHAKPFLVIVGGLSGSGKSYLARRLGERLGLPVFSSDLLRKQMVGPGGRLKTGFETGIYHPAVTQKVYDRLAREAELATHNGTGAILDATFIMEAQRRMMVQLADRLRVPLAIINCQASDAVIEKRLAARTAQGADISDADLQVYRRQKASVEAPRELPQEKVLNLDTDRPVEILLRTCSEFLRAGLDSRNF